jgi:5'-phosphate synthase pdxT subunit
VKLGVLALQGDHAAHAKALARAAESSGRELEVVLVRRAEQLEGLAGIALPGGESTAMLKLLGFEGLDEALVAFARAGGVVFGTCAGAILLAREVRNPEQRSLGLLDAVVERNGYGRQIDSFVASLETEAALGEQPLEGVFIRAPRFLELGAGVEVLARCEGEPVLVREGNVIACSFHPELTEDDRVTSSFLEAAAVRAASGVS